MDKYKDYKMFVVEISDEDEPDRFTTAFALTPEDAEREVDEELREEEKERGLEPFSLVILEVNEEI